MSKSTFKQNLDNLEKQAINFDKSNKCYDHKLLGM